MGFAVKDTLTEEEVQSGLSSVIKDGITTQVMGTLSGGIFLVGLALKLGASNFLIGLLAAIPPLAQLVQIPAIYLIDKLQNRRAVCVYASFLSRIFLLAIASTPFLMPTHLALRLLAGALLLHAAFAAIGGASWNSWMRDLVPENQLGSFFSKRMAITTGLGILISFLAAVYIDLWKKALPAYELYSYSILLLVACIAGLIGVYFVSTIPELRIASHSEPTSFFRSIWQPFKDENFKNLVIFLSSWNFAINLAAPFFTVYMLKRLQLDMSFVIAFLILSQGANLAFLRIWGKFSDRFSNKSVLRVCAPLFIGSILLWTFTTLPEKHMLTMPLLIVIHIFMGISTAGVAIASGNIGLKLAPRRQATAYLATSSVVNSLAAGIAPILGGKFADFFAGQEVSWTLKWTRPGGELVLQTLNLQQWDFFFFLAFLIGLYSLHRLAMVKELGEVEEKIVINELITEVRREVRNLSTVGGLRHMIYFPSLIFRHLRRLKR